MKYGAVRKFFRILQRSPHLKAVHLHQVMFIRMFTCVIPMVLVSAQELAHADSPSVPSTGPSFHDDNDNDL